MSSINKGAESPVFAHTLHKQMQQENVANVLLYVKTQKELQKRDIIGILFILLTLQTGIQYPIR